MIEILIALILVSNPRMDRADAAANIAIAALSPTHTDDAELEVKPVPFNDIPRVQLLIFSGKTCPPCNALKSDIKKRLIDEQIQLGKEPWKVGEEKINQFRYLYDDKCPEEFRKRNITTIPRLYWSVDGKETVTEERDPKKLAEEWYRLFNGLPQK